MKRKKTVRWAELTPEVGGKAPDKKAKAAAAGRGRALPSTDTAPEREAEIPQTQEVAATTETTAVESAPEDTETTAAEHTPADTTEEDAAVPADDSTATEAAEETTPSEKAPDADERAAQEQEAQDRRCAAMRERAQVAAARSAGSLAGGPARFDPEGDAFRRAFKAALR